MPSTVEQISPSHVKLTVEIPFADLEPLIQKAYKDISESVQLPGFRKGKVPAALIDQRFGRGVVLQEAVNEALPGAYAAAVDEHNLVPLGQPEVEVTELKDGELVEFTAEVDVRPEFDLPDFDSIKVVVPDAKVEDADIDEHVDLLRKRFATINEVERAAEKGDQVVINLVGSRDGEPLEDATAEDVTYVIGEGGMLDGLDEAVTGLSAGESATFSSELVGGALKGQTADIEVTVTKVSERELPEADDDFSQLVSEFDTYEEMREDLAKSLDQMARLDQAAAARDKILEAAIAEVEFELPEKLLEEQLEARKDQIRAQLAQAGMSLAEYLEQTDSEEAETEEEFWDNIAKTNVDAFKSQMVLDRVAEDANFEVSQEDLTAMLYRKASERGTSPEQEAQHMMEHNHMSEWVGEIRRQKALESIVAAATVEAESGDIVDIANLLPDGTYATEEDAEGATEEAE